jgi:hypothetical protein
MVINGLDEIFDQLQQSIFSKNNLINYKHLCGEYPTSGAFALWVAVNIIKTGKVPRFWNIRDQRKIRSTEF